MSFEQPKFEPKKPEEVVKETQPDKPKPEEFELIYKGPSSIDEAGDFDGLYALLDAKGELQGSQQKYSAAELKDLIEKVRGGYAPLEKITRAEGLREKVSELAAKELEEKLKEKK